MMEGRKEIFKISFRHDSRFSRKPGMYSASNAFGKTEKGLFSYTCTVIFRKHEKSLLLGNEDFEGGF